MGGDRPLSSLDSYGSHDRILVDATDSRLVAGVIEWLIGEVFLSGSSARYCWMSDLELPIIDCRRSDRSSDGLWQS